MYWEGFTGRSIRTDTEQWGKPTLSYFIKNGCSLSQRSWVILWMKTNSNFSSGYNVIVQEWKSSAKVTNCYVNDVVVFGRLGRPGWVTRVGEGWTAHGMLGSPYQNRESCSARCVWWPCSPPEFLNLWAMADWQSSTESVPSSSGKHVMRHGELRFTWKCGGGSEVEKQCRPSQRSTHHLALTRAASGHPGTGGSIEISCVEGARAGWTYPRRDLDKKEEEWEWGEGRNDSVGEPLKTCTSLSCWRYGQGWGSSVCCWGESYLASAVCHLAHPDGPWQQQTLISSTLANSANSPWLGTGQSLYSLHFPSPYSNGQINFLISLDTVSASGGKFSCIA